jgi:hypothetical protein
VRKCVLQCSSSKQLFLVDTGAIYSVRPFTSSAPPTGLAITLASGAPIPYWGWEAVKLRFSGWVSLAVFNPRHGFSSAGFRFPVRLFADSGKRVPLIEPPEGSA